MMMVVMMMIPFSWHRRGRSVSTAALIVTVIHLVFLTDFSQGSYSVQGISRDFRWVEAPGSGLPTTNIHKCVNSSRVPR